MAEKRKSASTPSKERVEETMTDSETLWLLFSAVFPIAYDSKYMLKKKKNPYKQLESGPFFTKSKNLAGIFGQWECTDKLATFTPMSAGIGTTRPPQP